jgi:arsenite-transporting ATPase
MTTLVERPAADASGSPSDATGEAESLDLWASTATRYLFCTGKGGVGKTTVASAIALRLTDLGKRTLIVSTDPASNLDDVFMMRAGSRPTVVPGVPLLWLMNLDPMAAAAAYRERVIAPVRDSLPQQAVRSMEEQLSGACTVEIAAFNEFTGLLADSELTERFDHIVFDTAPTGHTLRLLSLPSAWSGFIEDNRSGTSCLGPLSGLDANRAQYASAVAALSDPGRTTIVLVTRPDASALREAARAGDELRALGIANQRLVVNGLLDGADTDADSVAAAYVARQRTAVAAMPAVLRDLRHLTLPLVADDLRGVGALRRVGSEPRWPSHGSADGEALSTGRTERSLPGFEDLVAALARDGRGIIMTMGKGGVGKTTLAARIAVALARHGYPVHLSTTDPAAHVEAALGDITTREPMAGIATHRIDPEAETRRYTADVIDGAGELDPDERALLEEDLRSPCTEEIAVFRAFARTVAEAEHGFVVLDTAPTGHTLLLLDAAESYHRDVARTSGARIPDEVRELLPRLRNPRYAKMLLVTLPEATPVLEAARLQDDLRRAGIEPFGWVINASLAAARTRHPLLSARAKLESSQVRHVAEELARRAWVVPWTA